MAVNNILDHFDSLDQISFVPCGILIADLVGFANLLSGSIRGADVEVVSSIRVFEDVQEFP